MLVTDLTIAGSGPDATQVLKVAVDDAAAARIADEAGVLAGLTGPRLVRLVEGPLDVGGRQALVLESAGEQTLGEVLRGRERLSLDLLERWGTAVRRRLLRSRVGPRRGDRVSRAMATSERSREPGRMADPPEAMTKSETGPHRACAGWSAQDRSSVFVVGTTETDERP